MRQKQLIKVDCTNCQVLLQNTNNKIFLLKTMYVFRLFRVIFMFFKNETSNNCLLINWIICIICFFQHVI